MWLIKKQQNHKNKPRHKSLSTRTYMQYHTFCAVFQTGPKERNYLKYSGPLTTLGPWGPIYKDSYDDLTKKLRLKKFLGKSYESANLWKILGNTYEKVMKNLRTQNRSRKSLCKRKQWRICGRKDKVINESLHLSDLMDDEVFQMTHFRKLALLLTFFLRTS